jgi:hypothetical protein
MSRIDAAGVLVVGGIIVTLLAERTVAGLVWALRGLCRSFGL